jgi:hypothetical protein
VISARAALADAMAEIDALLTELSTDNDRVLFLQELRVSMLMRLSEFTTLAAHDTERPPCG